MSYYCQTLLPHNNCIDAQTKSFTFPDLSAEIIYSEQSQFRKYSGDPMIPQEKFMQPEREQEQSYIQRRVYEFRVEIRRSERETLRAKMRKKIMNEAQLSLFFQGIVQDASQAAEKCEKFYRLVADTNNNICDLPSKYTLGLYKLVQKFLNLSTLKAMKLAIERSSTETIHQLFQYEVMKLLHGIITFPGLENVRNSGHDFDSENVRFKSNVINNKNELIDNQCAVTRSQTLNFVQLDLAKTAFDIISILCQKSSYIRSFAIQNYVSYSCCLKAFKMFGDDIRKNFIEVLQATTVHPFRAYSEQYAKIALKLLSFFNQNQRKFLQNIFLIAQNQFNYLEQTCVLLKALSNMLRMKQSWVGKVLQQQLTRNNQDALAIVASIVRHCLQLPSSEVRWRLLQQSVTFSMLYIEKRVDASNVSEYFYRQLNCILHFSLEGSDFTRLGMTRKGVYFMLSNIFCQDSHYSEVVLNAVISGCSCQRYNLIDVINRLLTMQTVQGNIYQLYHLIMAFMGYEMMEARIRISGIFGRLIEILLEEYREGERGEDEKESAKSNLNKILITRMLTEYVGSRVKNTSDTLGYYYSTVMSYAGKLQLYCNSEACNHQLALQIDKMVCFVKNIYL